LNEVVHHTVIPLKRGGLVVFNRLISDDRCQIQFQVVFLTVGGTLPSIAPGVYRVAETVVAFRVPCTPVCLVVSVRSVLQQLFLSHVEKTRVVEKGGIRVILGREETSAFGTLELLHLGLLGVHGAVQLHA